jgi:hypothetical protein
MVQAPGFLPGTVVRVGLLGAGGPRPITVVGDPAQAYYLAPPTGIRVDGLFRDWLPYDVNDTDSIPVNDPNVDIVRDAAVVNGTTAFFHVEVDGRLLEGAMPVRVHRSTPGSGGGPPGSVLPLPRLTGEDILRVCVDLSASDLIGAPFGGIYADYCLEIRGQGGHITSDMIYVWRNRWVPVTGPTLALAKNATDIEGSVGIGPATNTTRLVFATTDWSGDGDSTLPMNATVVPALPLIGSFPVYAAPEFEDFVPPLLGTIALVVFAIRRRRVGSRAES